MSDTLDKDRFLANLREGLVSSAPKIKAMSNDVGRIFVRHRPSITERLFMLALEMESVVRGANFEPAEAMQLQAAMHALAADLCDQQIGQPETRIAHRKGRNF